MAEAGTFITLGLLFLAFYFEVFLLVSFLERQFGLRGVAPAKKPVVFPKVAIVVPCFNEERTVGKSLLSLLALAYPKEKLEILVIDDGSADDTYEVALRYANDPRVRVFRKENGGKHTALNFALARTDAELIGCLDADSMVDQHALERIVSGFENPRVAAVTPGIHVDAPRTLIQHLQYVEYRLSVFNRYAFAGLGSIFITPGPFSIFRASAIRDIGGWRHGHSTEDMELGLRLQSAGWTITNDPLATVYTKTPESLRTLIRQRVRWSYGFLKNVFDYRHMIGNPKYGNLGLIILPAALVSFGAGLYFAGRFFFYLTRSTADTASHYLATGIEPWQSFDPLFALNTSFLWITVYATVAMTVVLISLGTYLSTGKRYPPAATPIFLALYSFIVPLWLGIALVRAVLNTGVRWR